MKRILKSYGILIMSLCALFASGLAIGRLTAPSSRHQTAPKIENPANSEAWLETASRGLVRDLELDEAQQKQVRQLLEPVAASIFTDQERALFQMHLRLLELHDTLAAKTTLNKTQTRRLAVSRAKLRELIIQKFPGLVRGNPSLAIGS